MTSNPLSNYLTTGHVRPVKSRPTRRKAPWWLWALYGAGVVLVIATVALTGYNQRLAAEVLARCGQ